MVQSSKLGIITQVRHPPQNLNKNPTPGYLQHDGKHHHNHHIGGGGLPELKKKMKRSASVKKVSDLHNISEIQKKPTSLLRGIPRPSTPQKSPPNYMKSTTSSTARKDKEKERSPVSKSLINLDRKYRINSASPASSSSGKRKPSPAAGDEGKSPSLKKKKKKTTMRALTKVPSFKKCAESKNVRRSTCSSTMKDSKFPSYLVLDHGATEAQGTSVMKVCPYTYCSLNGHHHQPLPPLKCFLKAKRRSLKAQKTVSPRRRPVASEIGGISHVDQPDFFVEFFTKGSDNRNDAPKDVKLVQDLNPFDEIPNSEGEFDDISSSSGDEMVEDGGIEDASMEKGDQSCEDTEMEWVSSSSHVDVEGKLFESNEIDSSCTEEILTKELLRDLFEEETEAATSSVTSQIGDHESTAGFNDGFQELNVMNRDAEKDLGMNELRSIGNEEEEVVYERGDEDSDKSNAQDTFTAANQGTADVSGCGRNCSKQELEEDSSSSNWKWKIGCKRGMEEMEANEREFNPKDPNFLPLVPDPEGEKVDLKHQMMDERRNSEEWMIDHALQQTVTKLASARKRKVALLVEAFETVSPIIPKSEPPSMIRHPASPIFSPTSMQIQACR